MDVYITINWNQCVLSFSIEGKISSVSNDLPQENIKQCQNTTRKAAVLPLLHYICIFIPYKVYIELYIKVVLRNVCRVIKIKKQYVSQTGVVIMHGCKLIMGEKDDKDTQPNKKNISLNYYNTPQTKKKFLCVVKLKMLISRCFLIFAAHWALSATVVLTLFLIK